MMKYLTTVFLTILALTVNAKPITAKSFIVADAEGNVYMEKNADEVRPIASITKLMTVMAVIDADQDLRDEITLDWSQAKFYHTSLPRSVKTLTRLQLMELALIKSDNFSAWHLCEHYPYGMSSCIQGMNALAHKYQMYSTRFTDATGLDNTNVSTARDLSKLLVIADKNQLIKEISSKPKVYIYIKKKWWEFRNTNPMIRDGNKNISVSKTGYINASGGCLAMMINTNNGLKPNKTVIILGSKNTKTRVPEAEEIILRVSRNDIDY